MKVKQFFLALQIIVFATGFLLTGCELVPVFENPNANPSSEMLVFTGISNGRTLVITISQDNSFRSWRPINASKAGKSYEILLADELISTGRIVVNGSTWTFTPSSGSPGTKVSYNATFSGSTISSLSIPGTSVSNVQASTNGYPWNNNTDSNRPVLTGRVIIDNTLPKVGNILKASYFGGNGTGNMTWQWMRDEIPIPYSFSGAYVVVEEDVGKTLKVGVSFSNNNGYVFSDATAMVNRFTAVTDITGIPDVATAGTLPLNATVIPYNASDSTIIWTLVNQGTTASGAAINRNILTTTGPGTVIVRAAILNGTALGTAYTKDFAIRINRFVPVTGITGIPIIAPVGFLVLSGTVIPNDASNNTITWTLESAGTTKAIINRNVIITSMTGTIIVRAAISDGRAQGTPYTQVFSIIISRDG